MRKTFDAELQELNYEMIDMAAAAEDAIDVVTESLASGDDAAAKSAVEMTRSMDQMERDIENRCLRLLLQQQPVARDLRTISAAMKMVTDLQRIGDQCANIAEISLLLKEQKQTRTLADIRTMSQKAGVMVKRSIFAYVNRDTEAAQAVIALDDEVDALFRTIKGGAGGAHCGQPGRGRPGHRPHHYRQVPGAHRGSRGEHRPVGHLLCDRRNSRVRRCPHVQGHCGRGGRREYP